MIRKEYRSAVAGMSAGSAGTADFCASDAGCCDHSAEVIDETRKIERVKTMALDLALVIRYQPSSDERALQYNLRLEPNRMSETQSDHDYEVPEPVKTTMEIGDILKILPHRYPFLLIDRVVELVRMKSIVALKNVTITEPFFQGHFPEKPIMPGVLIVEAIAQAGGLLLLTEVPNRDEMLMVFTGIEKARFRRPVVPGDQLRIEVMVKAWRMTAARLEGKAYVDGKVAAEATVTCRLVPRSYGAKAVQKVPHEEA